MRDSTRAAVLFAGVFALTGCNPFFGIEPGKAAGGAGAGGTSGTGGTGGAAATCPPEKPTSCDPGSNDPQNCCVAGRSCGAGECMAGECGAELIVEGNIPNHDADCISLTVAGPRLFWTGGGNNLVGRAFTDGTDKSSFPMPGGVGMSATTRIASEPGASPAIVYFTDYYGPLIGRLSLGGGDIQSFAAVPDGGDQARYGNILVHGDFVYWAMQREDMSAPGKDIWRAERQPLGTDAVVAEKVVSAERPLALADDADYLYVSDSATNTISRIPWASLAKGASLPVTPEPLVTGAAPNADSGIGEMAVDDEYVYWGSEQTLWTAAKGTPGATPQSIGTGKTWVGVILADGRDVYFSTLGDFGTASEVIRVSKGGVTKTQRTMFEGGLLPDGSQAQIPSLAQDCAHVYVLVRPDCDVYRFTK